MEKDPEKMSIARMKEYLNNRNLPSQGTKDALKKRIRDYQDSKADDSSSSDADEVQQKKKKLDDKKYNWSYLSAKGWKSYGKASKDIEEAFKSGATSFSLKDGAIHPGSLACTLDLRSNIQTEDSTGDQVTIKREQADDDPADDPNAPKDPEWEWQGDPHTVWHQYDQQTNDIIEKGWQNFVATPISMNQTITLTHGFFGQQGNYVISFPSMSQKKLATKYLRNIRRTPPAIQPVTANPTLSTTTPFTFSMAPTASSPTVLSSTGFPITMPSTYPYGYGSTTPGYGSTAPGYAPGYGYAPPTYSGGYGAPYSYPYGATLPSMTAPAYTATPAYSFSTPAYPTMAPLMSASMSLASSLASPSTPFQMSSGSSAPITTETLHCKFEPSPMKKKIKKSKRAACQELTNWAPYQPAAAGEQCVVCFEPYKFQKKTAAVATEKAKAEVAEEEEGERLTRKRKGGASEAEPAKKKAKVEEEAPAPLDPDTCPYVELPCNHNFCVECVLGCYDEKGNFIICPLCSKCYGTRVGPQPAGAMTIKRYSPGVINLSGHPGEDTIVIDFSFADGIQEDHHENPGEEYEGTFRTVYLPGTREGSKILELFKIAFKRKLLFRIGTSITTGVENTVIWNGIHMKTNVAGGHSNFGYPDDGYFQRVTKELAEKGVTEQDIKK